MSKVLVVVHLEPDFKPSFELVSKVANYSKLFNNKIMVESASELSGTEPFYELDNIYQHRTETWIWGWPDTDDSMEDNTLNQDYIWCKNSLHDGAYIYDWMKELNRYDNYYLVGGGRNECLQDVYEIFLHLDLNVRVVENLTY